MDSRKGFSFGKKVCVDVMLICMKIEKNNFIHVIIVDLVDIVSHKETRREEREYN